MDHGPVKESSKILVMDDDEMIRFIAEQTLGKMGHEAVCVAHGLAAVEAYTNASRAGTPFRAVFLDLNIPGGIGGQETMKLLLEFDPAAKGFVMSGDPTDPVIQNFAEYGFHGAVDKRLLYRKAEMDSLLKELP